MTKREAFDRKFSEVVCNVTLAASIALIVALILCRCTSSQERPAANATILSDFRCQYVFERPEDFSSSERAECARREARKRDEERQIAHCEEIVARPARSPTAEYKRCARVLSSVQTP